MSKPYGNSSPEARIEQTGNYCKYTWYKLQAVWKGVGGVVRVAKLANMDFGLTGRKIAT